jgi:signal transduction histidine kinase
MTALAIAGWTVALLTALVACRARRLLHERLEAVSRATHELRGPLTAARLGLALEGLSTPRSRALDLELARAALALDDLAGDGQQPSWWRDRLGAGQEVDVPELLVDSVEAWRPAAAARGVRLRRRWAGAGAYVAGDRVRLAQAVENLIANAIEHGGQVVEVLGRVEGAEARLEVVDDGPGLPAPVAELVHRPRRARARARGARGRGLSIAAAIAAGHGGRLASAPSERGARIVLTLPIARAEQEMSLRPGG